MGRGGGAGSVSAGRSEPRSGGGSSGSGSSGSGQPPSARAAAPTSARKMASSCWLRRIVLNGLSSAPVGVETYPSLSTACSSAERYEKVTPPGRQSGGQRR